MEISLATYPWAYFTPGGGEIQIEMLYKYLKKRDINVNKFDSWNPKIKTKIYHFFSCMGGSIDFCNFLKSSDKKLIISSSLWITKDTMQNYDIGQIKSQLLIADRIIVNSEKEKDLLSDIFEIDKSNFRVVYNGFEPDLLQYRDKKFNKSHKIPVDWKDYILCIANIETRKNQHLLIEATKLSKKKLVLVGHIREKDYFNSLEIDNDSVFYYGSVDNHSSEFFSLLLNAKCFVLPSTLETPGLAALEAASLGIPIIVTSEGCTKEYFGGIDSYYDGKRGDVKELSDLINKVFLNPILGSVNLNQIKKFTWSNCIDNQILVYEELM
mgnify:CR=1 FL=1|tara:strand:+ start:248 stop:1222 length:975 start_codon:yes stop_codon:yes gene_type:complete